MNGDYTCEEEEAGDGPVDQSEHASIIQQQRSTEKGIS
jgi:hypothetical protein